MDVSTAMAMWEEANVGTKSQKVILQYMRGTFGARCLIPSAFKCEGKIKKTSLILLTQYVTT